MKKEKLIIIAFFGLSLKSYAGTGNANDQLFFIITIIGILLVLLGLISGVDYIQKNGKTMIYKAGSLLLEKLYSLRKYLNKLFSEYFDLSYL